MKKHLQPLKKRFASFKRAFHKNRLAFANFAILIIVVIRIEALHTKVDSVLFKLDSLPALLVSLASRSLLQISVMLNMLYEPLQKLLSLFTGSAT
jgi:hypothetical protein